MANHKQRHFWAAGIYWYKPTLCTALTMSAISTIGSNKLATFSVCEFTDSRSLYLPTLLLYNISSDVSSWPSTYKRRLLLPYSDRQTKHLERLIMSPQTFSRQTFRCSQMSEQCSNKLHYTINKRHAILWRPQSCFNKRTVLVKVNSVTSGSTTHSLTARTAKHSAGLQTQVGNCVKCITRVWEDDDDDDDKAKGKFVPLYAKGHIGDSGYGPPNIKTDTGYRRVVSFTSRPLHLRGKRPNMTA
jgi:hypothetical protein